MRRTLTAIIVSSLAVGILVLTAALVLDAWNSRLSKEAQAIYFSGSGSHGVIVDNPYQPPMTAYFPAFIGCCAVSTFWTVFVVIPSLLTSRRVFGRALASYLVAAVVVCITSGTVFLLFQGQYTYIPNMITFAVGGSIGLLSVLMLARMLPLNSTLEPTRAE